MLAKRLLSGLSLGAKGRHTAAPVCIESLALRPLNGCRLGEGLDLSGIEQLISTEPKFSSLSYKSHECLGVREQVDKECFFFRTGTIIGWNYHWNELGQIIDRCKPFQVRGYPRDEMERETFEFCTNDCLDDGPKSNSESQSRLEQAALLPLESKIFPEQSVIFINGRQESFDVTLDKLAFSHGLENSLRLATLERQLETFLHSIAHYPDLLLEGRRLLLGRREVLRKLGQLMKFRATLNLHSGLLEAPDLFWDNIQLEHRYRAIAECLDVRKRAAVLNKKLDYSNEIAALLREQLSERHSLKLEWCIIVLIAVEVLFEFRKF